MEWRKKRSKRRRRGGNKMEGSRGGVKEGAISSGERREERKERNKVF